MIKSITSTSPWLAVADGFPGAPYISPSSSNPATGMMRYNGQDIEVFDGSVWQRISNGHTSITMSPVATDILVWAQKKMYEEAHIKDLASKNVTIADALSKYEQAAEQLKVVLTLTDQPK